MPDVTITAPVAADPIDRLTLAASDARAHGGVGVSWGPGGSGVCGGALCMAEEQARFGDPPRLPRRNLLLKELARTGYLGVPCPQPRTAQCADVDGRTTCLM